VNRETFLNSFGHIADAPGGIDTLRRLILCLAVRGKLALKDPADEPASELLRRIATERDHLVKAGEIRKAKTLPPVLEPVVPYTASPAWQWTRIGTVFSMQAGSGVPTGTIRDSGNYPCYGGNGIRGYVDFFNRDGDYPIIGRQGALCGNINIARGKFYATEHAVVVGCFAGTSVSWAAQTLEALNLNQYATATAQPGLSVERISGVLVPVPPVEEQHRIVERVNELMGLCDELEAQQAAQVEARMTLTSATLQRLSHADPVPALREALATFAGNIDIHLAPGDGDLAALKQLRQTILDLAVRGRLTHQDSGEEPAAELIKRISAERDRMVKAKEIRQPKAQVGVAVNGPEFGSPAGWEWASLRQLVLFSDSGWSPACLPSRRTDDSQWGVLKVSAVSWGVFRADEHKLLTLGLTPRPQIEVQDGDFLMSRANTSALVGRSVVVTDPPPRLMLSDKHVRLRFLDRVSAEFVNLVNGSSRARSYYKSVATGTSDSMRNITREQILALPIPVPPLAEQTRIVNVVNVLRSHCDELEQQLLDAQTRRRGLSESVAADVVAVGV
jgi:type I restriction enzyme, S subunit